MKKALALILTIVLLVGFCSCVTVVPPQTTPKDPCTVHTDANKNGVCDKCGEKVKVEDNGGEDINTPLNVIDLQGQTALANTVTTANRFANKVQAYYENAKQNSYVIENGQAKLTHALAGNITVSSLENSKGNNYLINTLDSYVVFNGETYYGSDSPIDARVNTTKLGYYYYSTFIRDLQFAGQGIPLYLEKGYHMYSDRLHEQFRIVASGDSKYVEEFGFELKLSTSTISGYELKFGGETLTELENGTYTYSDFEYIGFDIKGAGVVGIITAGQSTKVEINVTDKKITVKQYITLDGVEAKKDYSFANRLYTDETHAFDGIRAANYEEQNPYTSENITVEDKDGAYFKGYNHLTGAYEFFIDSMGFNDSYFHYRQRHFANHVTLTGADDRTVYLALQATLPTEGSALLDATSNTLLPIPLQVGKNFGHEKEEPIYNPSDAKYGETIMPLVIKNGETYDFTMLNVYQEWGSQGISIKQLSSIEYFISYYHLSTGVTETNCIAPYYSAFARGKCGNAWVLPDFRGCSGKFWADVITQTGDPQYNSVGTLFAPTNDQGVTMGEYTSSDISYAGLTYADLDYSYIDPNGEYEYTMRHVEMSQTDESRTYYTIEFTFLKDTEINNYDFSIIGFDGRVGRYAYAAYLNADGEHTVIENPSSLVSDPKIYELNREGGSYFAFYGLSDTLTKETGNFGCIVKDFSITQSGSESSVGLAFLNDYRYNPNFTSDGILNYGSLTLTESTTFKAGDTISVDLILLPCGEIGQDHCQNVINVYEDSVVNAIKIETAVGTTGDDTWVPTVIAENNTAEFTVTGGTSEGTPEVIYALKVQGFDKLCVPKIYEKVGGQWVEYDFATDKGYDGYGVLCEDGKLTYTFTFKQTAGGRVFKIVAE